MSKLPSISLLKQEEKISESKETNWNPFEIRANEDLSGLVSTIIEFI